jgi:hypothetical protein
MDSKNRRNNMIVCATCGSHDIEELRWVGVNNGISKGKQSEEVDDQWCSKCEEHVNFKDTDTL